MILYKSIIWFAIYSLAGWIFECVYYSLLDQKLFNSGFLRGPYCPVYGFGALAIIFTLGAVENPVAIFFLSMLIAGSIEYVTGWLLEKFFHARWWDYSDMPFNLHGRIALISLLAFGVASTLTLKFFQPAIRAFTDGLSPQTLYIFAGSYGTAISIDCIAAISRLSKLGQRFADKANGLYQAALHACKPLRMARGVMEKVIWGNRPVKNHGGPTVNSRGQAKEP